MATHSSILAWGIPWTEGPGRLQSIGLQRVGHDLATKQQHILIDIGTTSMGSCNGGEMLSSSLNIA